MFGLIYHSTSTLNDQLRIFKMVPGGSKNDWIEGLVQQMKQTSSMANSVSYSIQMEPQIYNIIARRD